MADQTEPVAVPQLAATLRTLTDRIAIRDLCDRYLLSLDEGRFDQTVAGSVFTEDVALAFPPGSHRGLTGITAFTDTFMSHWARTHHHSSGYVIDVDGDRGSIAWNVIATHVRPDAPAPPASATHFHLGGRFSGTAVRTLSGWRLASLTLRVSWATGAGAPTVMARITEARNGRADGKESAARRSS